MDNHLDRYIRVSNSERRFTRVTSCKKANLLIRAHRTKTNFGLATLLGVCLEMRLVERLVAVGNAFAKHVQLIKPI